MKEFYRPFQPTLTHAGLRQLGLTMKSKGPCNTLMGIVYSYIQIEAKRQTPYPVMPDGTQAVYISPQGSMLSGALTSAKDVQLLRPGEYFGIWFYPGALRHFFDLNLSEISGQFVDGKYFQRQYFSNVHNEIYRHNNFSDRAGACERWLLRQYSQKPVSNFDYALSLIYQSFGNERVRHIANKVGRSSRHLNRLFLQYTGLNTKSFSQIIRAQHACKQIYLRPTESTRISFDPGYYDQPHLIKAFKKHFNLTPGEFITRYMSDFYNQ